MIVNATASPPARITKSPFGDDERCMTTMRAIIDSTHSIALARAAMGSVRDDTG
jgi:hypothetical protein